MNSESPPRARRARLGRRPAAAGDTRAAILEAARASFAARGFRGTTTRQIAERAGVDVALLHHFFGTKADLFDEALGLDAIIATIERAVSEPGGDVAERVVRLYLDHLFVEGIETCAAMLRTAVGSPDDVPTVRTLMLGLLGRVSGALLGRGLSPLAVQLVAAQFIGILVMRHIVGVGPIAAASTEEIQQVLVPAFHALMTAPAGEQEPT